MRFSSNMFNKRFNNLKEIITHAAQTSRDTGDIRKQLTSYYGLFMDLLREIGAFCQAVDVPLQDVPTDLIVEGETKL